MNVKRSERKRTIMLIGDKKRNSNFTGKVYDMDILRREEPAMN